MPRIGTGISRLVKVSFVAGLALAFAAPGAQARDFNCDASALRLQIASAPVVEPVTANRGAALCKAITSQLPSSIPGVAGTLLAQTTVPGVTQADSFGGLAYLNVSRDLLAGVSIPTLDAINSIPAVTVPISASSDPLNLLPDSITVDIRPAVSALVSAVNTAPLLELSGSTAAAKAQCVSGQPQLTGQSSVAALKVLGQTLPTDAIVQQALTLYNGQTIDPSKLDLSKIVLPAGLSFTDPLVGTILQGAVQSTLDQLPAITLPASLLNVSITPSSQQVADGGLTQHGLGIALSLAGQNILNGVLGEARVSKDSVTCQVKTPAGAVAPLETLTKQALSCSSRRLALLDVLDKGNHVQLFGAADRRLAGKRIAIYSKADRRVVARPVVSKAGLFHATAPLPPARYRFTNTARYTAIRGKDRSLALKLHRRMYFNVVRSTHGTVILRGVVTRPFSTQGTLILVRQRLTCHKQIVVARLRPDSNGDFSVRLKAPRNGDVGVYRATTIVAFPGGWAPDFRTYTLPGLVRFAR